MSSKWTPQPDDFTFAQERIKQLERLVKSLRRSESYWQGEWAAAVGRARKAEADKRRQMRLGRLEINRYPEKCGRRIHANSTRFMVGLCAGRWQVIWRRT